MKSISIVIPTYSDRSKQYLDLCIKSIRNLDYPKELIEIIISSPIGYKPLYLGTILVHHSDPNRSFAQAVNYGVSKSKNELILLLSDDTVITEKTLANMVKVMGDDEMVLGATSNVDNYWKYHLHFFVRHDKETFKLNKRFFRIEDLNGMESSLQDSNSVYPPGLIPTNTICFYAVMMPRKTWDRIGDLDEQFKDGYEDSDYCVRATKIGIPLVVELSALIWHFGGIQTSVLCTPESSQKNKERFEAKWQTK